MPTTYGSISDARNNGTIRRHGDPRDSDDPESLSLSLSNSQSATKRNLKAWLDDELGPPHMVTVNILLTLSTACLDVVMYRLYQTFSSNQTGNTVFLAITMVNRGQRKFYLALTSLLGWLVGCGIFGQIGNRIGHPRRLWIITTMSIQTFLLVLFCFLISPIAPKSFEYEGKWEFVPMLCSALSCGAQFAMCTNVGVPEVNAATATAAYASLVSDPHLFHPIRKPSRDRRAVYLATFWGGSLLGLYADQWKGPLAGSLVGTAIKLVAFGLVITAGARS